MCVKMELFPLQQWASRDRVVAATYPACIEKRCMEIQYCHPHLLIDTQDYGEAWNLDLTTASFLHPDTRRPKPERVVASRLTPRPNGRCFMGRKAESMTGEFAIISETNAIIISRTGFAVGFIMATTLALSEVGLRGKEGREPRVHKAGLVLCGKGQYIMSPDISLPPSPFLSFIIFFSPSLIHYSTSSLSVGEYNYINGGV